MKNHELLTISGKYKNKQIGKKKRSGEIGQYVQYAFDGYRLDELTVTLKFKSPIDVNYFLSDIGEFKKLLEIHKYCLETGYELYGGLK